MSHTPGPWRVTEHLNDSRKTNPKEILYSIGAGVQTRHSYPDSPIFFTDEINVVEVSTDRDYGYPEGGIKSKEDAHLIAESPAMYDALKAVLLFYSAKRLNDESRAEWKALTGSDEATTKVLCDHIHAVIAKADAA